MRRTVDASSLLALLLIIVAVVSGCSDTEANLVVSNDQPTVILLRPEAGDEGYAGPYEPGEGIQFQAVVADPEDLPTELVVTWSAQQTDATDSSPQALDSTVPDSEGYTTYLVTGLGEGRWTITATAHDTEGATGSNSLAVLILAENLPPEVLISAPTEGQEFVEGDPVHFSGTVGDTRGLAGVSVEWWSSLDGVLDESSPSRAGLLAFTTDRLSVGEHDVTLTVTDPGGLMGQATVAFTVVPADLRPTRPTVDVRPDDPDTETDLSCDIVTASTDPEGLAVSYRYTWSRNGSITAWNQQVLPAAETTKGETWTCEVIGNDGTLDSDPGSDSVLVLNTAPTLDSATITPSPAYEDSVLVCSATGWDDLDGDPQGYAYAWAVNGATVAGATGAQLNGANFDRDDLVLCEVSPDDGEDLGPPVQATVLILNSPPGPATPALSPSPVAGLTDPLACSVSVAAVDIDGDALSNEVRWLVDGVHDPAWDGVWTIAAGTPTLGEDWTCEVRAHDGTDAGPWTGITTTILPDAGDLVITEFLADPNEVSDAAGEWVEIYNASSVSMNLQGWELHDDGSDSHFIGSAVVVAPGARVVLARNSVVGSNGGVSAAYEYSGFVLENGVDEIVLSYDGLEVDRVNYNLASWGGLVGHSASLDPDLGVPSATINDNPLNWCGSTLPITTPGSDFGTPGAPNDTCLCWDSDGDGDGFGGSATACSVWDCNDNNAGINPAAFDVCENGIDEDCSGGDALCSCLSTDGDGDGFGDGAACSPVDCDDTNSNVNPAATEVCNGIDDNCVGGIDEGFDNDNDGWTTCAGDCNDGNGSVFPGAAEACNGIDDNCAGGIDEGFDNDNDGWTSCGGDCNDGNGGIYPGALDVCDGVNQDCDGALDENAAGDAYEPNNTSSSAEYIAGDDSSVTLYATFHVSSDNNDWYWIDTVDDTNFICDDFNITASLTSIPPGTDYDIYLYDSGLNLLDWSVATGNSSEWINWSPGCGSWGDDGGVYYVVVSRWSGWSCSDTYKLTVTNSD